MRRIATMAAFFMAALFVSDSRAWDDSELMAGGLKRESAKMMVRPTADEDWAVNGEGERLYDREGRLTDKSFQNNLLGRAYHQVFTYKYDETKRLAEKTILEINSQTKITYVYKYDEKGRRNDEGYYQNGELRYRRTTKYHDNGNVAEQVYFADGHVEWTETFNEDGQISKGVMKDSDGKVETVSYTYDEHGRNIKISDEVDGVVRMTYVYKYNVKGNMTEETWYDGGKDLMMRAENKYDEKSQVVEYLQWNSDGKQQDHRTYSYDAKGNLSVESRFTHSEDGKEFCNFQMVCSYEYYEAESNSAEAEQK